MPLTSIDVMCFFPSGADGDVELPTTDASPAVSMRRADGISSGPRVAIISRCKLRPASTNAPGLRGSAAPTYAAGFGLNVNSSRTKTSKGFKGPYFSKRTSTAVSMMREDRTDSDENSSQEVFTNLEA
ncbi:hypothetical protein HBI24_251120 [Parastagonospora nodorum]|nr:hypothetical protein HBI33_251240 [Parastagonospora nodorum]KAH5562797.1 hypothetical protein HBI24_251120 [Parastagonospora nodorum]KAH5702130.1 hypothetical protein HBI20_255790 [Parastagonospora nodorum]KAH5706831.1 hypothetical protein HBI18_252320 [Parastagonospora nodorum]KAH5721883.1 hypothetical protein HBI17_254140 [Parastagonospora nodorum]